MKKSNDKNLQRSLKKLYDWYDLYHRKLPFRESNHFYPIWVSEVMLQQTRVEAMLPIYQKFMKSFPDVHTLAKSTVEKVLEHWSGLGYYSRARNLHAGAMQIVESHDGKFPDTLEEALNIKGVGPYTASAVLSMSKGHRLAVVDGNVKRVLSRLHLLLKPDEKTYKEYAQGLLLQIPGTRPGMHNQALMECGALICKPKAPLCLECSLANSCKANQSKDRALIESLPFKKKTLKKEIIMKIHLIKSGSSYTLVKSDRSLFFKKGWFFPYCVVDENNNIMYKSTILSELPADYKFEKIKGKFKHHITHYNIEVHVYKPVDGCHLDVLKNLLETLPNKTTDKKKNKKSLQTNEKNKNSKDDYVVVQKNELPSYIVTSLLKKSMELLSQ